MACVFSSSNKIDGLDFNNATGQFFYRYTISEIVGPFDVEFSPNDSLLYAVGVYPPLLKQYNLFLPSFEEIVSNATFITLSENILPYSLKLAPNNKIYLLHFDSEFLDCIQNPNLVGESCNYLSNALSLNGKTTQIGLPNFPQYLMNPPLINAIGNCSGDTVSFSLGAQVDSLIWDFDDPISGILNHSNSNNPIHIYQNGGTYHVSLITFNGNQIDTLERTVNLYQAPQVSFDSDTFFCYDSYVQLDAGAGDSFIWQDGSTDQFLNVFYPEIYYVTASNFCGSEFRYH